MSEARIVVGADTKDAVSELERLKSAFSNSTSAIRAMGNAMGDVEKYASIAKGVIVGLVGIGSIAAFKGMITSGIEAIGNLKDLSDKTGVTVEKLTGLGSVAKFSGTSLDTVAEAMNKLSKNMATAGEDGKGAAQALKALGINFADFQKMSPDERMLKVSKAMAGFGDGSGKTAAAMMLFGKTGADLLPMLKDLAEAGDLSAKVTTEQAEMADRYGDNLIKIKGSSEAWKKELVLGLLPAMTDISEAFAEMAKKNTGAKNAVKGLAEDGSLSNWLRGATIGMSYLVDVAQGLASIFPIVGKAIGGLLAYTTTVFGSIGEAAIKLIKGDYSGAFNSLKAGAEGAKSVFTDVASDVGKIWNQKLIGETFRQNLEIAKNKVREVTDKKPQVDLKATEDTKAAVDKQVNAYADLIAKIKEKIGANKLETETGKTLTEAQKEQLNIDKLVTTGKIKLSDASSAATKQLLLELDTSEKSKTLALERVKADLAQAEAHGKYVQALADGVAKLDEQVRQQREATAEIGLSKDAIGELRAAELELQAAKQEGFAIRQFDKNLNEAEYNLALANVKVTRELAAAKRGFGARETAYAAEQEQVKEQLRLVNSVDSTAQSVWTNVFEGGSNAFKKLGQTLKSAVLDMLYQMTIRNWVINIAGSVTGASASTLAQAAGATANAATGGGGGLMGTLSNLSSLSTLTTAISTGVAGAVGSSVGAIFGTVAGNTALGTTLGLGAGSSLAAASAASVAGGGAAAGAGLSSVAGALGAIGPVGWAALAAAAAFAVFSGNKESASKSTGDLQRSYDVSGAVTSESSRTGAGNAANAIDSLYARLSGLQQLLGAKGAVEFGFSGYSGNGDKNPKGNISGGGFNSGEVPVAELGLAAQRAVLAALQSSEMPKGIAKIINSIDPAKASEEQIQALQANAVAYAQSIKTLSASFDSLPFENIKGLAFDAADALVTASGGLESFSGNLKSYYDNFYSEEEKRAQTIKEINAATAGSGLDAATATRDSFRALVSAQDVTTESGQKTYAALLAVSGSFASITPAAEKAAASIITISDTLKGLLKDRESLIADVLQAQGDTGGADAARRATAISGYSELEVAAYDYNQALRQEIKVRQDATTVAQAEAAERKGLQEQLNALTDTSAQALTRQRDAIGSSNQAHFDQVQAATKQKAALDASSAAMLSFNNNIAGTIAKFNTPEQNRTAQYSSIASGLKSSGLAAADYSALVADLQGASKDQIKAVAQQIFNGLGEGAGVAKESLRVLADQLADLKNTEATEAIAATNAALEKRTKAQNDAMAMLEKSVAVERRAAQTQADLAAQTASTIKSIFGLLKSNVNDLYGAVESTRMQSAREGNAFIANALLAAQTTGYLPDEEALSDAIGASRKGIENAIFATQNDEDVARLELAGKLSQLKDLSGKQLTEAERQAASAKVQLEYFDNLLINERAQLDALQGLNTSVLSVPAALAALMGTKTSAAASPVTSASSTTAGTMGSTGGAYKVSDDTIGSMVYYAQNGLKGEDGNRALYDWASEWKSSGVTLARLNEVAGVPVGTAEAWAKANGLPAFANGGSHSGGLRMVGERGWEVEATGPSRVWNQEQIGQALRGGNSDRAIEALTQEVARLCEELTKVTKNTAATADMLDKVTEGGNAMKSDVLKSVVPA